jgi:hypothetical protein
LGTLIASSYKHDLIPLLTTEETAHYVLQSVLRSATPEDFESKLGRQEYSIGKYRNVIRATVPIVYIDEDSMTGKVKFYLLGPFDVDYGAQQPIETKILPLY